MGRKGKWLGAVKKAFIPESTKEKKGDKSKRKWLFGKSKHSELSVSKSVVDNALDGAATPPVACAKEIKVVEVENEHHKRAYSEALGTTVAAVAAMPAAPAAAEVVRLTTFTKFAGKSREEVAAIKIQTAFRGHLARRAFRALRGLVRLRSLIHGNAVKRQATTTLRCMQTLAKVQSQIRSRRIRMSEENQALQHQLLLKHDRGLEELRMGEEWDDSLQSKEQIEASYLSKQEASVRRERALAYAFSHQWKSSSRSANPLFLETSNPHWGWSWLERWMAARPWESKSRTTANEATSDHASVKSVGRSAGGEMTKAYAHKDTSADRPSPVAHKSSRLTTRHSPSTPPSKVSSMTRKMKSSSSRSGRCQLDDDCRSIVSMLSEPHERHSIGGSSIREGDSLASSPSVPSYMAPTEAVRAKSRFAEKIETPQKHPVDSTKKRLSFPLADNGSVMSPAVARRLSGPPKVDVSSVKDITVETNGGGR